MLCTPIPIYFIQKESRDNIISIVTNSSKSPEKALNRLSEAFQTGFKELSHKVSLGNQ